MQLDVKRAQLQTSGNTRQTNQLNVPKMPKITGINTTQHSPISYNDYTECEQPKRNFMPINNT
jgi:hypothetical protein